MKKWICLFACLLAYACTQSEERKKSDKIEADLKSLPKLSPIEVPAGVAGLYIGTLPCDECSSHQIKMELDSNGTAQIEEIFLKAKPDTVKSSATFLDSADHVVVRFDDKRRFLNFQKKNGTALECLNVEGKPYVDETDEPYRLIRILKPKKPQ